MVKNESKIIKRCLESVENTVDAFCILDTGSTDNTVEIVEEFLKTRRGCVTVEPWKNFGYNRSVSFDNAQRYVRDVLKWNTDTTYGLLLDADMMFVGNIKNYALDKVGYSVMQINGCLEYSNIRVIRLDFPWKCVGVTHEYWDGPNNGVLSKEICYINDKNDGGCKHDKYERDCILLEKGLESEPNNPRYMFYLAQTYNDMGKFSDAVKWYKKRYEYGGWFEEMYISAYKISKITKDKEWVWKAHECDPTRIESLVSYIAYCRETNKITKEVLAMAMYAATIAKPSTPKLFLETAVYDWRVWDELSIIAYYTGHKDISRQVTEKLISENKAPPDQMLRIKNNLKFSL